MVGTRRGIGDDAAAARYRSVCRRIEELSGAAPDVSGRLERLGDVVADYRLAALPGVHVDPTGALAGLDDDELADWWSSGCALRSIVVGTAARGHVVALDWIVFMMRFAERGTAHEFGRTLAEDTTELVVRVAAARTVLAREHDVPDVVGQVSADRVGWSAMPIAHRSHAFGRIPV